MIHTRVKEQIALELSLSSHYQVRFPFGLVFQKDKWRRVQSCILPVVSAWGVEILQKFSLRIMGNPGISSMILPSIGFYPKVCSSSSVRHTLSEGNSTRKTGISSDILLWLIFYTIILAIFWLCLIQYIYKLWKPHRTQKQLHEIEAFSTQNRGFLFEPSGSLSRRNDLLTRQKASIFNLRSLSCWDQVLRIQYCNIKMQWNKCGHTFSFC